MSKQVWKYPIADIGEVKIPMPYGSKVVFVAGDPSGISPAFWAEVDPAAAVVIRTFMIVGTGRELPNDAHHHGSGIQGPFAWHLYELYAA